ncbi:uncharacterized protein BDZ99DRAFT_463229 [Mytilinidion resinicola]|uniref:NACHT-NTPase and P-loop NTPases N-terminal domain-containing protein n=1 Tax=Mytilinidion resinicola TaxID=574789 RepID=A0A6A6YKN5_9PEZI|nr:uncharacterized protein BDZ99DRAFT_463229 [Mytilinidion resinicola]KAF2809426.1 hypothetical protein BDZ99DRAFT_463229 [Mytilinidion resinicola]
MSGFEILGLIAAIISIAETTAAVYEAIKDLHGLPEAFKEVNQRLPLVEQTLLDAKTQTKNVKGDEAKALESLLTGSKSKAEQLLGIFKKIAKSADSSVVTVYKIAVLKIGKKGRVETLMQDILKDLQIMTTYQVFKTAVEQHVDPLKVAEEDLAKTAEQNPSLPDSEFDEKPSTGMNHFGQGDQYAAFGSSKLNHISGDNYKAGGDMNFGTRPKHRSSRKAKPGKNEESSDED